MHNSLAPMQEYAIFNLYQKDTHYKINKKSIMFKNDVFKLGYEAAKANASTCLSGKEDELLDNHLYDNEVHNCGDDNIDDDGTCLVCGAKDLF